MGFLLFASIDNNRAYADLVPVGEKAIVFESKPYTDLSDCSDIVELLSKVITLIRRVSSVVPHHAIVGLNISLSFDFDYSRGIFKDLNNKFRYLFGLNLKDTLYAELSEFNISYESIAISDTCQTLLLGYVEKEMCESEKVLTLFFDGESVRTTYKDSEVIHNNELDCSYSELIERTFHNKEASGNIQEIIEQKGIEKPTKNNQNDLYRGNGCHDVFQQIVHSILGKLKLKKVDRIILNENFKKVSFRNGEISNKNDFKDYDIHLLDSDLEYLKIGAKKHFQDQINNFTKSDRKRKSTSAVLPLKKDKKNEGYDIYPTFRIKGKKIEQGFATLVNHIIQLQSKTIIIDGNIGTIWQDIVKQLNDHFRKKDKQVLWYDIDVALKKSDEIDRIIEPYIECIDPIFGYKYPGKLVDFFSQDQLRNITPYKDCISIIYGTGAALSELDASIIYIDQPKNEIQFRSRAKSITNLGTLDSGPDVEMYKRFYFIDWPVCNRHKKTLLNSIDVIADGQRLHNLTWATGESFIEGLREVVRTPFRVRPWFEPGVWGGQWMKQKFKKLDPNDLNYAWSFELITAENGVIFESDGLLLEIDFEFVLGFDYKALLGRHAKTYGEYFPLRFNYLDTIDGGNLSLQCHPSLEFMQDEFGEPISQDETYYILENAPNSAVYLGFVEDIDKKLFSKAVIDSEKNANIIDVEKFVQTFPTNKHDLFLIPSGTIHSSGKNNMVLEISNAPHIYTFKIYDWLRDDLNGKKRPLSLNSALENLNFEYKGAYVQENLISRPELVSNGDGWKLYNLPTHEDHLYAINRIEIECTVEMDTDDRFNVLNLVEGELIYIENRGHNIELNYAETIILPSSVGQYRIHNPNNEKVKILNAYMK